MTTNISRKPFTGALTIARYNWPFYAAAITVVIGGLTINSLPGLASIFHQLAILVAIMTAWFAIASFLAAYWVFDRSELTQWYWLRQEFTSAPAHWVHITTGLEETHAPLTDIFPGTVGKVLDIYDPKTMSEPAIARARQLKGAISATLAQAASLPVDDGWADAIFLLMTAHELRQSMDRIAFFKELARILSGNGKLILVEHLRDLPNALAFGPGCLHFFSKQEWLHLGNVARLTVTHEYAFTPFVRVFIYQHKSLQS